MRTTPNDRGATSLFAFDGSVLRIDISEALADMLQQEPEVMHAAGTLLSWIARCGLTPRDRMAVVAWVAGVISRDDDERIQAAGALGDFLASFDWLVQDRWTLETWNDVYGEAMQRRDWQTCDYMLDERNTESWWPAERERVNAIPDPPGAGWSE